MTNKSKAQIFIEELIPQLTFGAMDVNPICIVDSNNAAAANAIIAIRNYIINNKDRWVE